MLNFCKLISIYTSHNHNFQDFTSSRVLQLVKWPLNHSLWLILIKRHISEFIVYSPTVYECLQGENFTGPLGFTLVKSPKCPLSTVRARCVPALRMSWWACICVKFWAFVPPIATIASPLCIWPAAGLLGSTFFTCSCILKSRPPEILNPQGSFGELLASDTIVGWAILW